MSLKPKKQRGKKRKRLSQYEELQEFKLFLFCKDVLSIIDSYVSEGFNEWSQYVKDLNREYFTRFETIWDNGTIYAINTDIRLFNFRYKSIPSTSTLWHIYHYDLKRNHIFVSDATHDTKIVLDPKKYL